MGIIKLPSPVLLFIAAFAAEEEALSWGHKKVESHFGPIHFESNSYQVENFTDYYRPTMGQHLTKRFWGFSDLIDPARLAAIKCTTNRWEDEYREQISCGKNSAERPLNLDPGYIDLGKFILASTKDHAHRIYLSDGIFAETTLFYRNKKWETLPWSYPDYAHPQNQDFLTQCRNYLKNIQRIVIN
ncbi:MAG: DUF4416 family protein [Thermoguttaceae bacterium]